MENKGLKIALVIVGVVALGVGAYFIFRPKKDDRDEKDTQLGDSKDEPLENPFETYIVTTKSGNLNLRSAPATTSNIIQSLPKGSEILARVSQNSGWHEVSDDGKKVIGFVSSQFIQKK